MQGDAQERGMPCCGDTGAGPLWPTSSAPCPAPLPALHRSAHRLCVLLLSFCSGVTDAGVASACEVLKGVAKVDLAHCALLSDEGAARLAGLRLLTGELTWAAAPPWHRFGTCSTRGICLTRRCHGPMHCIPAPPPALERHAGNLTWEAVTDSKHMGVLQGLARCAVYSVRTLP